MQQQHLEFHSDTPLKTFIESIIITQLDTTQIDYNNDTHINTLLKKITSICDVLPGMFREKQSKNLIQLFNLFSPSLSEQRVSLFYYDTFIRSQTLISHPFLKNVVAQHIDNFPLQEWRQQLLKAFGIKKSSDYSYAQKCFFSEYEFTALSEPEKQKIRDYYHGFFKDYIIVAIDELSMNDMLHTLLYIAKDLEKNKFDCFVSKEEFMEIITSLSYKISYECFAEDINKSEYATTKEGVNLVRNFYKEIFNSTHLYPHEKSSILYTTLNIDKNHFYQNKFTVTNIILSAVTESVKEMLETVSFPIGTASEEQIILELANAKNITKGVGIRVADFFLTLCEQNFEVGKMVVEYFLPSIKHEMFLDSKTHELQGLDFLMAYCQKKQKNSITIANKYQSVHKTMTTYEKEKLSRDLQLELPFKKERFKL